MVTAGAVGSKAIDAKLAVGESVMTASVGAFVIPAPGVFIDTDDNPGVSCVDGMVARAREDGGPPGVDGT